jgi:cytoskeletal protein CcmA (bactofilin family)
MSLVKYIEKIISKEKKELPHMDELHVSGLFVQNDIVALDDVCVTKSVTGNIYCAKNVIVSKDVQIIGNINCRKCTLEGKVNGNISAFETLEIKVNAVLNGNIMARHLSVSSSAVLNGYIITINVKDGRQIYSDIKLKIDEIKNLNEEKESIVSEIPNPHDVQNDSEELNVNSKVSKIDIQTEQPKPVNIEDNGKWW